MSEKFYILVTKYGQAQIANALALSTKVEFGQFVVGDGGVKFMTLAIIKPALKMRFGLGRLQA